MTDAPLLTRGLHEYLSSTDELIEEARNGRPFILVDDEDRENEGDLVIPAQFATPDVINFMARHCRGLICLAMTRHRVEQLGLPLMSQANGSRHQTAFTVSIEARHGITTGISAHDRAHTVAVAINPENGRDDIVTPGHIFPLVAREGGTLVRTGHTEAAVDIARLAGVAPAGVICEIMNDDGTMSRLPQLVAFAQHHNIKLGTIADLIAYRRRTERLVKRVEEATLEHGIGGDWRVIVYANTVEYAEHLALVMIAREGRGVVVLLREMWPTKLSERVRGLGETTRPRGQLRDYGIGAQILLDLGVRDMVLLSNTQRTIVGWEGYGLKIVEQRRIDAGAEHGD
jgi:3,4-dihydroxy 2-butanone 4-phosphate synthase/GTP cyclohydrolase II